MADIDDGANFEATVRRVWARLVAEQLPRAAKTRSWPVSNPAGFERVLLDHVLGAPWETRIAGSSVQAAETLDLVLAIETAGQVLAGEACLSEMNRRSLELRAGDARRARCAGDAQPSFETDGVAALLRRAVAANRPASRRHL